MSTVTHSRAGAVARHYTTTAAAMRQRMRVMLGQYLLKADDFGAFNPHFDADFATHFLAAIDAGDAEEQGSARRAQLTEDTEEVLVEMAQARTELQMLFYFVGLAYPHQLSRLNEYGRRNYVKAAYQPALMQAELAQAFKVATRDHVALAAKGYTAPHLAALDTIMEGLNDKKSSQGIKKGTNSEATDHFITVQNLAYSYGQEVSAASKILFADNPTLLEIFRLGDGTGPATETHTLELAVGETKAVEFTTVLVAPVQLRLHLVNAVLEQKLYVGRSTTPAGPPASTFTLNKDDNDAVLPVADLGPEGQYLWVNNSGTVATTVEMSVEPA